MRKIDDPHYTEDKREANAQQGIRAAHDDGVGHVLRKLAHSVVSTILNVSWAIIRASRSALRRPTAIAPGRAAIPAPASAQP
jgi:hypothetical protein